MQAWRRVPSHLSTETGFDAVLALPALAWLLARTRWDESRRTRVVARAATTCVVLAVLTLAGSLAPM